MSFKIGKLILKNTSDLIITGPLTIDVKRLILANVALAGVQAPLTVDMHCKNWTSCLVSLTKEAMITIQDVLLQSQRQSIRSKESLQFIVKPQENMLVLQEENPYISYQIPLEKFAFEGKFEGADGNISIDAASMIVSGAFADEAAESSRLSVNAQNLSYEATGVLMKNANVSLGNVFQNSAHIQIDAEEAKLVGMPFLSNPFKLNLNMVGPQAAIRLDFKDAPIAVQMDGQLSLAQKAFAGQIRTNVIDLGKLTIPPQELFAGIPSSVKELSGSAVVYGQLKWMGAHSVGGPLNIGLKDVSFSTEETKVSGVNTVLTLDALQPLLVKQNQHVYVERINGLLPFQDIDILFQADNQNMRINQVSLLAAGVPVSLPASVVALKNANMLVYLKNDKPIDAKAFAQGINLPDLEVSSGTANLSIPLELQNGVLSIPSVTLKMQSVLVERQSDEYENVFGTANHYYIRTGQIIMDENNVMQLALNGRLLPSKQTKDVQENNVTLPSDVFKEVALKGVPKDIQKRQHILFGE